jgi:hypothetical protein
MAFFKPRTACHEEHQVQTFECPYGLHLSQLGEDMAVLQFER